MSFNLAESMGVIEAAHSHTILGEDEFFGTSIFLFMMNRQKYLSLPEELRAVIDRNSGSAFAREMGQVWLDAGNAGIGIAQQRGNRLHHLLGEEAEAARTNLEQVIDRWRQARERQGIDGEELIRKARSAIEHHSR